MHTDGRIGLQRSGSLITGRRSLSSGCARFRSWQPDTPPLAVPCTVPYPLPLRCGNPTPTASYREVVKKTGENLTRGSRMPWLSNRDMSWVQRGTRGDAKRGLPADISHTGRQVCTSFWPKVRTGIEIALYQSDASVSPQGAVLCGGIGCVGSLWPPCNTHEE
jgi:hypothetical protein